MRLFGPAGSNPVNNPGTGKLPAGAVLDGDATGVSDDLVWRARIIHDALGSLGDREKVPDPVHHARQDLYGLILRKRNVSANPKEALSHLQAALKLLQN
jgi:hypothetical protein